MLKLLHDATSFDLLPPTVKLSKTILHAGVAYCMCIGEVTDSDISHNHQWCIVKGMWLGAEQLT